MQSLWKIKSGEFAGWRSDTLVYDAAGRQVGYLEGSVAYSLAGFCLGEIHGEEWIGLRTDISYPPGGVHSATLNLCCAMPQPSRAGLDLPGWEDPHF